MTGVQTWALPIVVTRPSPLPPPSVSVRTATRPPPATTSPMDPRGGASVPGLSARQAPQVLLTAVGHFGSMAESLHNTVSSLEELGIADRFLWSLQELVADRIEAATTPAGVGGRAAATHVPGILG